MTTFKVVFFLKPSKLILFLYVAAMFYCGWIWCGDSGRSRSIAPDLCWSVEWRRYVTSRSEPAVGVSLTSDDNILVMYSWLVSEQVLAGLCVTVARFALHSVADCFATTSLVLLICTRIDDLVCRCRWWECTPQSLNQLTHVHNMHWNISGLSQYTCFQTDLKHSAVHPYNVSAELYH